jgi:hypothetical protein
VVSCAAAGGTAASTATRASSGRARRDMRGGKLGPGTRRR